MKKALLLFASAALLFAGCAKEQIAGGEAEGDRVTATFTMNLATEGTKAVADNDGFAANVNHWVLQVRDAQNDLFYEEERDVAAGTLQQTYELKLFKNQEYTLQFWADTKGAYDTEDLTAVSKTGLTANADSLDAFSANVTYTSLKSESKSVTLYRPFAQLNIITCDLDSLKAKVVPETYVKYAPTSLKVIASVPTTFDVQTQTAGTASSQTLTATASYANFLAGASETTLFMDYIFASDVEADILNIDFDFMSNNQPISYEFKNIPLQRNYRTNIKGNLMSNDSEWTVTIDKLWDGNGTTDEEGEDPYLVNYYAAGSIAAANEALKTNNAVSIENPQDLETDIVIPTQQDGKEVSIKISGATSGDIVIKSENEGASVLNLEADAKNLNIDTPESHVNVNTGNYASITARTGDNTLVIGKDVKTAKLTTTKGAVVINGQVEELSSNEVAQVNISTADALMTYATALNARKYSNHNATLVADIDMTGKEWVPMNAMGSSLLEFDGDDNIISNLTTTEYTGSYYGLFECSTIDIKNVTVKDAVLTYPSSVSNQARGGAIVGILYSGNIVNCHVDGAQIKASQKIGGIVGYIDADSSEDITVNLCSVKNVTVSSNYSDVVYQAAGIVGYIQQEKNIDVSIENCSVENFTVNDAYSGTDNQAWHNHTFVGCINATKEGTVIALADNTVDAQLPVERTAYTTDYFGWAGNPEKGNQYKAVITIDGTPWTPNYPVKNVTKGTAYPTLAKAVSDASADDVITLENGEYTLPGLSNITIKGIGDNVVVNHSSGSICATSNATIKNIVFNLGQNGYHGFQHASNLVLDGCIINGFMTTYGSTTYKNCTFNQDIYAYNMNAYGAEIVCENCTFNGKGKAVYVYNEGSGGNMYHISFNGCTFNEVVGDRADCKAAILVKRNYGGQKYIVNINGCEANFDKYVPGDPDYTGSSLWNTELVSGITNADVKVYVDDVLMYDNAFIGIANKLALKNFADAVNAGKSFSGQTVSLNADIDLTGVNWVSVGQTGHGQFGGTFDGQGYTISNLNVNNDDGTSNCATGLFGWLAYATVKNVNVSTATVSGHHNVGVIAGYLEGSTIENCTVTGATVSCTKANDEADGDKCGGIVGFAGNAETPVKNCTVSNTAISAGRDAGQVAGAAKEANLIDCTATDVTVTHNGASTGANIRNEIIGRVL